MSLRLDPDAMPPEELARLRAEGYGHLIGKSADSEDDCLRVVHREYDMKWVCTLEKGHDGPCNRGGTR